MPTSPHASPVGRLLPYLQLVSRRVAGLRGVTVRWEPVAVWGFWALAVLWTGAFVARYGFNLPAYDEFAFITISYSSFADQFQWLGARHMEHRFPLARYVFLTMLEMTNHDFRACMWVTVGVLAGTAASLMLAARALRGRTSLADAAFPILFLHAGHTENLLMGYQIVFTITVLAVAVFALVVARSGETSPGRSALRGAACVFVMANGGWLGLVFVPWAGLWVAWQAWRAAGDRGRRWMAAALVLGIGGYLGWSGYVLLEVMRDGVARAEAVGLAARLRAVAEVTGIGLGPGLSLMTSVPRTGVVLLALQGITGLALAVIGVRRPEHRAVAWGLLAVLMGGWSFAGGIGYSRGSGLASRYTTFTALNTAVVFLALAKFAPRFNWLVAVFVLLAGGLLVPQNQKHAKYQGRALEERYLSIVADIRTGMPMDVLADRHVDFWLRTREGWLMLWKERFPLFRDVPPPVEKRPMEAARYVKDGEYKEQHLVYDKYRVRFGGEKQVQFVRVKFKPLAQVTWEQLMFEWTDPRTAEKKRSVVKPWVRPIDQDAVFWIDGPIVSGELVMGREGCRFEIQAVEYFPRPKS